MNIVYIGNVGVEGTAMSVHAQNIAWMLEQKGHKVSFVCLALQKNQKPIKRKNYKYPLKRIHIPKMSGIEFWYEEFTGSQMFSILKSITDKIDVVILYGCRGESRLIDYCHKQNIIVIMDAVDWFEVGDVKGLISKLYLKLYVERCRKVIDKKLDGVIAISKYLVKYYKNQLKIKTVWIPPVFEIKQREIVKSNIKGIKLKLVYAGSLGEGKDSIQSAVMAVKTINQRKKVFEFDLVGISSEQLCAEFGVEDWEKHGIIAHGWCTHEQTKKIVEEADFSFLLRENKIYAKAGFSTKFAESMCHGVPVICTEVGGADVLIQDMQNGILVVNNEQATIENKLKALLSLSDEEILNMKKNAYDTAHQYFERNKYVEELEKFLEDCRWAGKGRKYR